MADELAWILDFDKASGDLERNIYHGLREAVLSGRLKPGTRLPSTRALAADLSVSRGTVVAAFEQLVAEGYILSQRGQGSRVAELPQHDIGARGRTSSTVRAQLSASARADRFGLAASGGPPFPRCFQPGMPSLDEFPRREWSRCLAARARAIRADGLSYEHASGLPALQSALAVQLYRSRGVSAEPEQIVIVPSAQAAFDVVAVCTTDPGDTIAVEDPGYLGARHVFEAAGAEIAPVPVDDEGIVVSGLDRLTRLRMIAVTPSHQYPTGVTMSLGRRLDLLAIAGRTGAFILEDDYDSEFRYAERPIAALQGIDDRGSVIYAGTFSKTLAPGIRAAFLIAPPELAPAVAAAVVALGQVVSHPVQAALADFITEGYLAAHIGRLRPLYAAKRDRLVSALTAGLPKSCKVANPRGGLQLLLRFPDATDDVTVAGELRAQDIAARPLSSVCMRASGSGLLLGFALPRLDEIEPAAERLCAVARRFL